MQNPTNLNSKHFQTYMAYSKKTKNTLPFFKIMYFMMLETHTGLEQHDDNEMIKIKQLNFIIRWTTPLRAALFNKVLQLTLRKRADFDNTQSPMLYSLSVSLNSRNRQHPVASAYVLTRPPRREWKGAALFDWKGRLRPACIWSELVTPADCEEAAHIYRKYGYN